MSLYEKIVNREEKIALVGLGYVGMPIAVAFAKKVNVIGYDLNAEKIKLYKNGVDPTNEVGNEGIKNTMGAYIANAAVKQMIAAGQAPRDSKVVILGLTFKENCPDTRNSKVDDIIKQLKTYDITPVVIDPWANESDALREYGVELKSMAEARDADCVIVAVAHNEFKAMSLSDIKGLFRKSADAEKVLLDVKGLYKIDELKASGMRWWRL